jgi:uncharacterized membrane protein YhaH (DUF805 family)
MEWMILPLKRYAQFSGRSRRKEYWMFFLFIILCSIILGFLDGMLGLGGGLTHYSYGGGGAYGAGANAHGGILSDIFSLAILIPGLAVSVRRLHDIDKSGWWILIGLIPLVGWIIVIVWYCTDGTRGPNRFGPDPKADLGDLRDTFS